MDFCSCSSTQFVCHAAQGCICRQGFIGRDCTTPSRSAQQQDQVPEASSAGIAWGIVLALMAVAGMVFGVLYHRRRVRKLKTVIADVEFHANPQSQPDRHHFDNPVYAFNDNATLLNNLPPKLTNIERMKMGFGDRASNESNGSSRGKILITS